ncbi:MAG: hypothetical protein FWD44_02115 [Oscillospiraceae bacterium]|nr:hypothetical protein [Oscillospiraceae bacterium]
MNKKTIKQMPKKDVRKMCEDLKAIGEKYKIAEAEKIVFNSIMSCLQLTWNEIHGDENILQM